VDVLVVIVRGQHDQTGRRHLFADGCDGVDAVHLGHAQVDQGDLGPVEQKLRHRLTPGGGFRDHPHVLAAVEKRCQPLAHHRMVIRDQNRDRAGLLHEQLLLGDETAVSLPRESPLLASW